MSSEIEKPLIMNTYTQVLLIHNRPVSMITGVI